MRPSKGQRDGRLLAPTDVIFQLRTEFCNRILDRPTGAVREAADGGAGHDADRLRHFIENIEVFLAALAGPNAVEHLHHPASPLAARRALSARFVSEEPADIIENIDDAGLLVEDGNGRGAQAEAADLAGAVEIERRVEFLFGHHAHADAAGDAAFRLASFPDAATVPVEEFARRDSERQFDAARRVDVSADAIE